MGFPQHICQTEKFSCGQSFGSKRGCCFFNDGIRCEGGQGEGRGANGELGLGIHVLFATESDGVVILLGCALVFEVFLCDWRVCSNTKYL